MKSVLPKVSLLLPHYLALDHCQFGFDHVQLGWADLEWIGGKDGEIGKHSSHQRALLVRRAGRCGCARAEAAQGTGDVDALLGMPATGRQVAGSLARDG